MALVPPCPQSLLPSPLKEVDATPRAPSCGVWRLLGWIICEDMVIPDILIHTPPLAGQNKIKPKSLSELPEAQEQRQRRGAGVFTRASSSSSVL